MSLSPAESASLTPSDSRQAGGGTGCYPSAGSDPPVTGAYAWYDPSDVASVTVSSAGIVTALADKSGNARHSTSVGGTPILARSLGLFAERAALYFDSGAGNQIAATGVTMSDITFSAFVVAMCLTVTGRFPTMLGPSADAGLEFRVNSSAADRKLAVVSADTVEIGRNDANLITLGTPFVAGMLLSATDVSIYNGLNVETDAHAITLTAGRTLVIGRSPTVAGDPNRMLGWIGEIILYDSTLTAPQAVSTIEYLLDKWAVV